MCDDFGVAFLPPFRRQTNSLQHVVINEARTFDPGKDNGSVPRYVFCKIMAAAVSDTEERLMERADGGRSIMAIISIADSGNL